MNIPRSYSRHAVATAIGTSVAMSNEHVTASLLDGICDSEEEARELAFRINVKRDQAKFAARASRGLASIIGGK